MLLRSAFLLCLAVAIPASPLKAIETIALQPGQKVAVTLPRLPPTRVPRKLDERFLRFGGEYVQVYRMPVERGQRYTVTFTYPSNQAHRQLVLTGENPLTDYTPTHGRTDGVTRIITLAGNTLGTSACERLTLRRNFTISAGSQHSVLYLVAMSAQPADAFEFQVRTPADPDADVEAPGPMPGCSETGLRWSEVIKPPLLLVFDPSEEHAAPPLPLNQWVKICLPKAALRDRQRERTYRLAGPYTEILRWEVQKGARYTLYLRGAASRHARRRLVLLGQRPTRVDQTGKGRKRPDTSYRLEPPRPRPSGSTVTAFGTVTIAPSSSQTTLWGLVSSATMGDCVEVLMQGPGPRRPLATDGPKDRSREHVWRRPFNLTDGPPASR